MEEEINLIEECTDKYSVQDENGKMRIMILVPKRFKDLWLHKLSELHTTMQEITDFEGDDKHTP